MEWVVLSLLHSVVSLVLVETNRRNTPIGFSASFVWFVVQKNCSNLSKNAAAFVEEDAFEIHLQRLRVRGFGHRFLLGDFAVLDELE